MAVLRSVLVGHQLLFDLKREPRAIALMRVDEATRARLTPRLQALVFFFLLLYKLHCNLRLRCDHKLLDFIALALDRWSLHINGVFSLQSSRSGGGLLDFHLSWHSLWRLSLLLLLLRLFNYWLPFLAARGFFRPEQRLLALLMIFLPCRSDAHLKLFFGRLPLRLALFRALLLGALVADDLESAGLDFTAPHLT